MVFELVDGTALLDYIVSHGSLKEKAARPLFRQILEAVGPWHAHGWGPATAPACC
jgi:serine/threonine protein kinase